MVSMAKRPGVELGNVLSPSFQQRWEDGVLGTSDHPRGREIIEMAQERGIEIKAEHLEKMCAAYLMATDIDPREVVLVEDRLGGTLEHGIRTVWYFARKSDVEGLTLHGRMSNDGEV